MIALYILLGLLVLLLLPIGARFRFDGESRVTVRYAGIPVWWYSSKKQKKLPQKAAPKSDKAKKQPAPDKKKSTLGELTARLREDGAAAIAAYLKELARLLSTTTRRLFRVLRFGRCRVHIAVATPDAADTALRYGKLCGVVYPAWEVVEQTLHIRRLDVCMQPDFLREKDEVQADIRLHAAPLLLLGLAIRTLFSYLKMTIRLEKRKDGQDG